MYLSWHLQPAFEPEVPCFTLHWAPQIRWPTYSKLGAVETPLNGSEGDSNDSCTSLLLLTYLFQKSEVNTARRYDVDELWIKCPLHFFLNFSGCLKYSTPKASPHY